MPKFSISSNKRKCQTNLPTRKSPRTIQNFLHGVSVHGLNNTYLACLIAICYTTGCSAGWIAIHMKERFGVVCVPEDIWETHWEWINAREKRKKGEELEEKEREMIEYLLEEADVKFEGKWGRSLHKTSKPVTVRFSPSYVPRCPNLQSLYPDYTSNTRAEVINYISNFPRPSKFYERLTRIEKSATRKFGSTVCLVIKDTMKRWGKKLNTRLLQGNQLRDLKNSDSIPLVCHYLEEFREKFEAFFGTMERYEEMKEPKGVVVIKSTGFCAKLAVGLMMNDRLHVINHLRRRERERICFEKITPEQLALGDEVCFSCLQPYFEADEGEIEQPIKLVICCNQIIGFDCLRTWLNMRSANGLFKKTCPMCRFEFPKCFLDRFCTPENMEDEELVEDEEIDLENDGEDDYEGVVGESIDQVEFREQVAVLRAENDASRTRADDIQTRLDESIAEHEIMAQC